MFLGRVVGNVVATRKIGGLKGIRLLLVQPVTDKGVDRGGPVVAADTTLAGPGDVVHVTPSREAAMAMPDTFVPVDHAILAIVDHVGGEPLPVATQWPAELAEPAKRTKPAKPTKRTKPTKAGAA